MANLSTKQSKEKTDEQSKKTSQNVSKISVKVSAMWHFVAWYLEMLDFIGATTDEEFCRRLKSLLDYVYGKIDIPQTQNIIGEYVVYELEA